VGGISIPPGSKLQSTAVSVVRTSDPIELLVTQLIHCSCCFQRPHLSN